LFHNFNLDADIQRKEDWSLGAINESIILISNIIVDWLGDLQLAFWAVSLHLFSKD
jgi:hypothetical protein